jgi:hypothetical protein
MFEFGRAEIREFLHFPRGILSSPGPPISVAKGEAGRGISFPCFRSTGRTRDPERGTIASSLPPRRGKRLVNKAPDGLGAIRKVRLLAAPVVDLGNEVVVNPHLEGSWHCTARRPPDWFFGHKCNFGIDTHARIYHNDCRLGKSQNQTASQEVLQPSCEA